MREAGRQAGRQAGSDVCVCTHPCHASTRWNECLRKKPWPRANRASSTHDGGGEGGTWSSPSTVAPRVRSCRDEGPPSERQRRFDEGYVIVATKHSLDRLQWPLLYRSGVSCGRKRRSHHRRTTLLSHLPMFSPLSPAAEMCVRAARTQPRQAKRVYHVF